MFDIQTQLFESDEIRFGPIDFEKDPEIESKWTHDAEFMRLYDIAPARPLSAAMVKKQYEKLEKDMEERKNEYYFAIPEYNVAAIALFKKAGFVEEVCRRKALERDGRRWDFLMFGLLKDEWLNQAKA